ncbi:lytic polysaccharide monooxygenase [Paenibacillus sp. FJAT-26967]|uniref:lytic polysaccharide monooxygenase n=1 Tax=Paenibacillus sp. FJAT-26967 TaxID=1729690 RepID=UPI0008393B9A|nr:lytic polysaccharide monooxygenase [Paenibacillus sp. FJAT-26967]
MVQQTRLFKVSPVLTGIVMVMLAVAFSLLFAKSASAHGYIEGPASRAALCKTGANVGCGAIQYEPQSLEAKGNYPAAGPADGQIAGAGAFPELNVQTADRWTKVNLNTGANNFTWKLTAAHATKEWKYYITKPGWNPNKTLARSDFDLFCSFNDGGKRPDFSVTHSCNIPTDRTGYNVILAVWEISDTGNAFYNVIDVNLGGNNGGGATPAAPSTPANLASSAQTTSSVSLSWSASTAASGIKNYEVYRNNTLVGTTTTTSYSDTGLTANTTYSYTVKAVDNAGTKSIASSALSVKTAGSSSAFPAWNATTAYVGGSKVTHNGVSYQAKWWTQGETPGSAGVWQAI